MEAQGAQPQGQGKWISRLKAGYIQCTWPRSEHPSTNTQGFIYKEFDHPVDGACAELNRLGQGKWIPRLKAGYTQCAWPRVSMPHKLQHRLSFAMLDNNESRASL